MRRQPSETNQSVKETDNVPETHSYQEEHVQPPLNESVSEDHSYCEYGYTVTPDESESKSDKNTRSDASDKDDYRKVHRSQNNSDSDIRYSVPDVSSGVFSGSVVSVPAITHVAAAIVAVVIIGAAVVIPIIEGSPTDVIFEDVETTDSSIYYRIFFQDYQDGMDLTVSLHNNFTNRVYKVTSERIEVVEKDLKPDMEYTISVTGPLSVTISERTVKTDKTSAHPTFTMESISLIESSMEIEYACSVSDPAGWWSDYYGRVYVVQQDGSRLLLKSEHIDTIEGIHVLDFRLPDSDEHDVIFTIECAEKGLSQEIYNKVFNGVKNPESAPSFTMESISLNESAMMIEYTCSASDPGSVWSDYKVSLYTMMQGATRYDLNSDYFENIDGYHTMEFRLPDSDEHDVYFTIECTENGESKEIYSKVFNGVKNPVDGPSFTMENISLNEASLMIEYTYSVSDPEGLWSDYKSSIFIVQQDGSTSLINSDDTIDSTGGSYRLEYTLPDTNEHNLIFTVECTENGQSKEIYNQEFYGVKRPVTTPSLTMESIAVDESSTAIAYICTVSDPEGLWSDYIAYVYMVEASTSSNQLLNSERIQAIDGQHVLSFSLPDTNEHDLIFTIECLENGTNKEIYSEEFKGVKLNEA